MQKELLTKKLRIRLSETEDLALAHWCKTLGEKTRSRLVRKLIRDAMGTGPYLLRDDLNSMRDITRQVSAIGVNLNQIARILNSKKIDRVSLDPQMIGTLMTEIRALKKEWKSVILRSQNRGFVHE